jgi:hypothetical protein
MVRSQDPSPEDWELEPRFEARPFVRVGRLDLRAQAEVPSALRADTPTLLGSVSRSMCPQQIGDTAFRAAVVPTDARMGEVY